MSPYSKDQFNVWFPALFCGLVIGLIAAAGWDFLRRRFWCCVSRFWPGVLGEVGLDNLSRVEVEERMRLVSDILSEVHSEVTKLRVTPSLSMAKSIHPTAAESSNSSNSSMSSNNDFDLEGQEPVIHPFPASTGRPITFTATAYFADGTPAAATIQCLSYENENKISIGNAGAIPALVELLQNGTLQGKKDAASALCNLTSYQEGNKRQAIRAGIALVLKKILHEHSSHRDDIDYIFLSILANLSVLPDGLVEIGNTEPVTMLINFITCGSSKGQELATALLCRLCLADPCFIESAYHCGATDPLEAVLRSETATLRCKCKAQRLLDRLSDGAQRRQEVVNVRREVLEYVNDRREVLNPISQLGQEMKRLRMTKMGLVGSPRASGSNSALQKSTLASKEPQEQPRFRQSVTGESPSWLTEREFPLHCHISKVSKLNKLPNDSGNSTKFWHPYGPQIPRHNLYP